MQKLLAKLKNVPTGAPQACSSTSLGLNRDQSLSDQDKVRTNNNLEVDLPTSNSRLGLRVPVTGKPGKLVLKSSRIKNSSFINNKVMKNTIMDQLTRFIPPINGWAFSLRRS